LARRRRHQGRASHEGDITRGQLAISRCDSSFYDAQPQQALITIDAKNPKGKQIIEALVKHCDAGGEFAPGVPTTGFT
jgi:formyl-CoA transferase